MQRTEVHKFGGTSVAGAERLRVVAGLVARAAERARVVVVSSAMAGVTDRLLEAVAAAVSGNRREALRIADDLTARHLEEAHRLGASDGAPVLAELRAHTTDLREHLAAAAALRELPLRSRDRVLATGEKLAIRLFALALHREGIRAEPVDTDEFLETDGRFGEAEPLGSIASQTIRGALRPRLGAGVVPVVTGFVGRSPEGDTTTLGRGGSDLSATVIAAALDADEVTIWTDVDGVYSADPRAVPEAQRIPQLNYREATELSFYGAKVLHQRTIIPVAAKGIPVRIRNSLEPASDGTTVDSRFTPGSHPVKAISAINHRALISVEGKGMAGVPGVAARVFRALADRGISVTMISQSSSEASITMVVPDADALEAELALKREFRPDITHGAVEEVVVRRHVGLIAAVGLGMAHTPGVSARVFTALGRARINILAIAQGSSELNISVAVEEDEVKRAVRAIHEAFELHRLDTGSDAPDALDILLLGCGQIGRALAELVIERRAHVFQRFGLQPRIVGIADRSGYLLHPGGIPHEALASVLEAKSARRPLASLPGGSPASHPVAMVRDALRYRLSRPLLVDVSDAPHSDETFLEALRHGCDVVTANKQPLSSSYQAFQELMETSATNGRILRAEATVGAGLPVVDTLEMLIATGDRLREAEGCLSGTLGFLMTRLEEEVPFSAAVEEAMRLGYTEPDPVVDLSGVDVARKATILGRVSGLVDADAPVHLTGLVDASLAGLPRGELLARLAAYDAPIAARAAEARREGNTLRYVARVVPGRVTVGLEAVPAHSPLGALHGTDNLILFRSDRYKTRPLVVVGPGAGVEVTAMGVLSDIFRVAAERR